MRDPKRIDLILSEIKELWYAHPDWRLGQLIVNVFDIDHAHVRKHGDLFFLEDDLALNALIRKNESEGMGQ